MFLVSFFSHRINVSLYPVTVPEGGVKEGETFQVPLSENTADAVTGHWRVGLFDTCDVCTGLWWMGCFCSPILMGQVMQRLGLDAIANPNRAAASSTCTIITIITIGCSLFYILRLPLLIYILVFATRYRMYMRKKYDIPTQNCGDGVEDCCCIFWCGCCVACQTHRHTHDETKYKYSCCSQTGLGPEAPSVV